MTKEILSNIDNCINACNDLLKELEQKKHNIMPFSNRLTFSILSKSLYDTNVRIIENKFNHILKQIVDYFSTVSIYTPQINEKGNSKIILRMFSPIYSLKNVDSKIRKLLSILHSLKLENLYYTSEIAKIKSKEKKLQFESAYKCLHDLEKHVRSFLEKELSKHSRNWWKQFIPEDIRQNAECRKKDNEKPWPWSTQGESSLTEYFDFNDYLRIIIRRDNWKNIFKPIFKDVEVITAKFKELDPIRKTIAHNRDLTESDTLRLNLYRDDIVTAITRK
jgi:HEPN superfamily Swt1-like protein